MRRSCPTLLASVLLAGTMDAAEAPGGGRGPALDNSGATRAGRAQGSPIQGVSGAYAYRTHCATCHGADGKGDGPLAENLRFHPPDLTLIAKRNGGEFPVDKVHRIVDGRRPLKGHGGPDMPVWGDAFKDADTGYDDARVREKIRSVVDYVRTLQVK